MTDPHDIPGVMTGAELLEREQRDAEMPARLKRLWDYLRRYCRGKARMRTTAQIGADLGVDPKAIVHHASALVKRFKKPVGSECTGDHRGIYVAVTSSEKRECAGQLRRRAFSILERARAYDEAPTSPTPPVQRELGFPS